MAKKLDVEEEIEKQKEKLADIENPIYTDVQCKEIRERITDLDNELEARQNEIDILKGELTSQITSIKEMIAKVLDKDISLAEKLLERCLESKALRLPPCSRLSVWLSVYSLKRYYQVAVILRRLETVILPLLRMEKV